jgi:hypothetical protein
VKKKGTTTGRKKGSKKGPPNDVEHQPHRVRLPGFLIAEEIGLGDVVKRVMYSAGLKPCRGCEKRGAALNRWVRFSR